MKEGNRRKGGKNEPPTTEKPKFTPPAGEPKKLNSFDTQVGGDHYKNMGIQPTEYILANNLPFCEGCIVKYATRWRDKGGLQDLEKIIHYAQILIDNEIEENRLTECCPKGDQ